MPHPRTMNPDQLEGLEVLDSQGAKVGKVEAIYLDVENGKPEWAAVKTGMFGGHATLVPLVDASATESEMTVPYTKDTIKNAPHHDPAGELSTRGRGRPVPPLRRLLLRGDRHRPARTGHRPATHPDPTAAADPLQGRHRRRDDPLGGAALGGYPAGRGGPGPAA